MEWISEKSVNGKTVNVAFKGVTGNQRKELNRKFQGREENEDKVYEFLAMMIVDIPLKKGDKKYSDLSIKEKAEVLGELWDAEIDSLAEEYSVRRAAVTGVKKPSTSP